MGLSSKVSLGSKFWNIHVNFLHSFHHSPSPDWLAPILFPFSSSRSQSKPAILLHASSSSTNSWNKTQNGTIFNMGFGFFPKLPPNRCLQKAIQNKLNALSLSSNTQPGTSHCFMFCYRHSLVCKPILSPSQCLAFICTGSQLYCNHETAQYFHRSLTCSQGASGIPMSFPYPPGTTYVSSYTNRWRG